MTSQGEGAVLVTGGAKRLGRAVALRLADEGWDIAIHYNRSSGDAEAVAAEIQSKGRRAEIFQADLDDPAACAGLIAQAAQSLPNLEGLVNSASVFAPDMLDTMEPGFLRNQAAVNAEAPLYLTQALMKVIDRRGWVFNFIDCKVFNLSPDFFSYTLSKLALENVTRMCAMACAPKLRVNGIGPGLVLPSGGQSQAEFDAEHDQIPLRQGPTPDEIAHWVVALARSPSATGQIIAVDGGRHFYTPADLVAQFEVPDLLERL